MNHISAPRLSMPRALLLSHRSDVTKTKGASMTLDEYTAALKRHDWFYEYSDDHKVWTRGREQARALNAARQEHDKGYEIWNQYAPKDCQVKTTTKG
jgi:hypothetical protein